MHRRGPQPLRIERVPEPTVRVLVEEQLISPAPAVEVEHKGLWWPGTQSDDARRWMVEVRWTEREHQWGPGTYDTMVTPDRVGPASPGRDG